MPSTEIDAQKDLNVARHMMARGRVAAALDGAHLVAWGLAIVTILFFQYFAEARDWLPSSQLWLWQPLICIGLVLSFFFGRLSSPRRFNTIASRTYVAAFAGAALALGAYVITSGLSGRPDQFVLVLLTTGLLGCSFLVTGIAIQLPRLHFATLGWWLTFTLFCFKGKLVLSDFHILIGAFSLFMVTPGLYLNLHRRQLA